MKPFNAGKPIASWLFRICTIPIIYNLYNIPVFSLNFENLQFYIGLLMFMAAIGLFLGGFLSKPSLTISSGSIIILISAYKLLVSFNGIFNDLIIIHLIPLSIGFYFFSHGNEN